MSACADESWLGGVGLDPHDGSVSIDAAKTVAPNAVATSRVKAATPMPVPDHSLHGGAGGSAQRLHRDSGMNRSDHGPAPRRYARVSDLAQ
jgi:hypothetical protein